MLRTKAIVSSVTEVPREWVFEFYAKCKKLQGQDEKMKSILNPKDRNPSFCIYFSSAGYYKFKDFSANKSGDGVDFVKALFKLTTRGEAAHKIIEDYNQFILTNKSDYGIREFKVHQKYKVTKFEIRKWNTLDQKYWTKFGINSKLLEEFNVKPLNSYIMSKEENGEVKELSISGRHYVYGYFRADGTLYMIYQPMVKDCKFIRVRDYIQGTDQLTFKVPYLIICSSLKDSLSFKALRYSNAEVVAPNSENTIIPEHVISGYKLKYKKVCVMFDNDEAGILAMGEYKRKYDLSEIHLKMSKDLSDSVKDHGIQKVRDTLTKVLKNALSKTNVQPVEEKV